MWGRQRSGAVVCRSCGRLVGVNDKVCANCGARYPALWGMAPVLRRMGQDLGFTELVMGGCGLLYLLALLADPQGISGLLSPSTRSLARLGAAGALPVWGAHRWWTVLSAGWLHGSALHIFFNLMWIRALAPATAEVYGVGRMVILYTVSSVVGFAVSSSAFFFAGPLRFLLGGGSGFTVGASAAIFGLLGALIHYSRRGGSSEMGRQLWMWAIFLIALGFFPGFRIDNWAHLGGFGSGYLLSRWLDPLKPETLNHLALALLCVVAMAASIVASVLVPLPEALLRAIGG